MSENEKQNNEAPVEIKRQGTMYSLKYYLLLCLIVAITTAIIVGGRHFDELDNFNEYRTNIKHHLNDIEYALQQYRATYNRFPANEEGLAVLDIPNTEVLQREDIMRMFDVHGDEKFRTKDAVFSPWLVPFIYENREGLNPDHFENSPATIDSGRNYSVKINDNIYVYSVGAKYYYNKYIQLLVNTIIVFTIAGGAGLFCIIMYFKRAKKRQEILINFFVAIIGLYFSAGFGAAFTATCYFGLGNVYAKRPPEMINEYNQLLEKYRDKGIIKQDTYTKLRDSFDNELNQRKQNP